MNASHAIPNLCAQLGAVTSFAEASTRDEVLGVYPVIRDEFLAPNDLVDSAFAAPPSHGSSEITYISFRDDLVSRARWIVNDNVARISERPLTADRMRTYGFDDINEYVDRIVSAHVVGALSMTQTRASIVAAREMLAPWVVKPFERSSGSGALVSERAIRMVRRGAANGIVDGKRAAFAKRLKWYLEDQIRNDPLGAVNKTLMLWTLKSGVASVMLLFINDKLAVGGLAACTLCGLASTGIWIYMGVRQEPGSRKNV